MGVVSVEESLGVGGGVSEMESLRFEEGVSVGESLGVGGEVSLMESLGFEEVESTMESLAQESTCSTCTATQMDQL